MVVCLCNLCLLEIISDYPSWFLILCVLGGLAYAVTLYTKDRTNRHFSKWLIVLLGIMRFTAVTLIALFLLKPLIKSVDREEEKPIIVIAQDNSVSIGVNADSAYVKSRYLNELKLVRDAFGDQYDVRTFSFGETVTEGLDSIDFSEKFTDYSTLMEEMYNRFSNRNLGAIVIGSDGLYNKGLNPEFASTKFDVPIYTIALGDTSVKRDVLIKEVANNRLAYLGNKFPIEVVVEGIQAAGETVQVTISRKGANLFSQTVRIEDKYHSEKISTSLSAEETGLQRYTVSISGIEGEFTTANNRKDIFIDVLDSRQKILLLAAAPHPDLAALTSAIETNRNYEVEVELEDDFDGELSDYNLVIFHQVPSGNSKGFDLIHTALQENIPSLHILGSQTNFNQYNGLKTGFSLKNFTGTINDIHCSYAKGFSLFKLSEGTQTIFENLPPLQMPFGDFDQAPGATPLLTQRVGLIETPQILVGFNKVNECKIGVIAGEGLWRWRLVNFLETQDHKAIDEFISKTVQYLANKEDKSFFRVTGESDLLENQSIILEAELYNQSYELNNNPDVELEITDESGAKFEFVFGRRGDAYRLDAGSLPVGNYSYEANTSLSGKAYKERGEFSISPVQLELTVSKADHGLLYRWAQAHEGELVYPSGLASLPGQISARKEVHAVAHETKVLSDLINLKWILFLMLGLLCIEWLLRKRNGTY